MSVHFTRLPFDLCREVLWNWVCERRRNYKTPQGSLLSFRALDMAYCSREERVLFLSWIQGMELTFRLPFPFQIPALFQWLTSRNLQVMAVETAVLEKGCEQFLDNLVIGATGAAYEKIFSHVRTLNMEKKGLYPGHLCNVATDRFVALMPSIVTLEFSTCTLEELDCFIRYLPNPHILKTLVVRILIITEHALPTKPWWALTPHLNKLDLMLERAAYPNLISQLCSALTELEEFNISALEDLLISEDILAPMLLHSLHSLNVSGMPDPLVLNYLLRGCPNLRKLTLFYVTMNMTTLQHLVITIIPALQEFKYSDSMLCLSLISHHGQPLSSSVLSPRAQLLCSSTSSPNPLPIWPFELLEYLWLYPDTTAHLDEVDLEYSLNENVPEASTFLVRSPHHCFLPLTTLTISGEVSFLGKEWATILSYAKLKSLTLESNNESINFEDGLVWCSATRVQSNLTHIVWLSPLSLHSRMSVLLPLVCPHITSLEFMKSGCTDADLLHLLLHLPILKSLSLLEHSFYGEPTESEPSLTALNEIDTGLWEQIAAVSSCTDLTLSDLPMQSWPAVRRMLDSSMGAKLRRVRVHPLRSEESDWKELRAREHDYLESRPCRVRIVIFDRVNVGEGATFYYAA